MKKITLLSQPSCCQCSQVKRLLENKSVQYDIVDCTSDEGFVYVEKYGLRGVPALLVGDTLFRNYGDILKFIKSL